jgi:uncharacterized protein YjbI with pentapeptide repeats
VQQDQPPKSDRSISIRDLTPRWNPTRKQKVWAARLTIVLLVLLGLLALIVFGFNISLGNLVNDVTIWDWVKSLILPAVVAIFGTVGGAWFTRQRAQETALQAYLDKMSELLIDEDLHKKADRYDATRVTARARTLAILRQLDGRRKRIVLLFLRESRLINSKARCRKGQIVAHARLVGLKDADLRNADLRAAKLISTSRGEAVSLEGANLEGADLAGADLERADLREVNLERADLREVILKGADLRGADLRGAVGITNRELDRQARCLAGATMPDGQKYEDCSF